MGQIQERFPEQKLRFAELAGGGAGDTILLEDVGGGGGDGAGEHPLVNIALDARDGVIKDAIEILIPSQHGGDLTSAMDEIRDSVAVAVKVVLRLKLSLFKHAIGIAVVISGAPAVGDDAGFLSRLLDRSLGLLAER